MSKSILQDWVQELGLRQQGVLLTGVRGCDLAPKDDPTKLFVRSYRAMILVCHCGDPRKARTFIEEVEDDELLRRFTAFRKNCEQYPSHWFLHMLHCIEIIGYCHPDPLVRGTWSAFYYRLCDALHVNPETRDQLNIRLNADEEAFAARDWCYDGNLKQEV